MSLEAVASFLGAEPSRTRSPQSWNAEAACGVRSSDFFQFLSTTSPPALQRNDHQAKSPYAPGEGSMTMPGRFLVVSSFAAERTYSQLLGTSTPAFSKMSGR